MFHRQLVQPLQKVPRCMRCCVISKRTFTDRENCMEKAENINKCNTQQFAKRPCTIVFKKKASKLKALPQYEFGYKSLWENPKCFCDCVGSNLRHDVEYLKSSETRRFQRTWFECPERCWVKKGCSQLKVNLPLIEKRPRGVGNPDAKWCAAIHRCGLVERFQLPCELCKTKKVCVTKSPKCCRRRCVQYPSYSECIKAEPRLIRDVECKCNNKASLCELNSYLTRMKKKPIKDNSLLCKKDNDREC